MRGTHILESTGGILRTRKGSGQVTGTHKLETTKQQLVRTQKETNQATCTHFLETTKGGTCQDMERS